MFTFALNSAICGIAGVLVSMIWVLTIYGIVYSLRTFAIVTAAGLGLWRDYHELYLGLG